MEAPILYLTFERGYRYCPWKKGVAINLPYFSQNIMMDNHSARAETMNKSILAVLFTTTNSKSINVLLSVV